MIFISLVIIFIYTMLNIYLGKKISLYLKTILPKFNSKVFWIIYTPIFLSYVIGSIFRHLKISKYIDLIGAVYLGIFYYLILILLILGLVKLILRLFKIKGKEFFKSRTVIIKTGSAVTVLMLIITIAGLYNGHSTKVVNYDVKVNKTVEGMDKLNIVMISDIHMGDIIGEKRVNHIISQIKDLNPDIVLLAGDIFDNDYDKIENLEAIKEDFKRLKPRYGVYGCFGNHDVGSTFSKMAEFCKEADINILEDEYVVVDDKFILAGRIDESVQYYNGNGPRKSMEEIIQDADLSKPVIMLDHQPSSIEEAYESKNVDLLLSGHTHKGQLFPGNLITERLNVIDYGQYTKDDFNAIVSCGVGTWGPPMRIGSRSEITQITVTFN